MIQAGTTYATWRDLSGQELKDCLSPLVLSVATDPTFPGYVQDETGAIVQDETGAYLTDVAT